MTDRFTHVAVGALLLCALSAPAQAASLILNGSFEDPLVAVGGYTSFGCGSAAITNWTVVCPSGTEVAIVSGSFTQSGFSFPAQDGNQWLDLTGAGSNAGEGVQQTVATVPGSAYSLSFYVGNVSDPTGIGPFGTLSTVLVNISGVPGTLFASSGLGTTTLTWAQFTIPFTATGSSTTISFFNADPPGDNSNGLDNVMLTERTPSAVPEPASLVLLGTGLLGAGAKRWRRRRTAA